MVSSVLKIYWLFIIQVFPHLLYLLALLLNSLADCGTLSFKDENIRKGLKARLPERDDIDGMSFGAIKEYDCSFAPLSVILHSTYIWEIVNMLTLRVIASNKACAMISPF